MITWVFLILILVTFPLAWINDELRRIRKLLNKIREAE